MIHRRDTAIYSGFSERTGSRPFLLNQGLRNPYFLLQPLSFISGKATNYISQPELSTWRYFPKKSQQDIEELLFFSTLLSANLTAFRFLKQVEISSGIRPPMGFALVLVGFPAISTSFKCVNVQIVLIGRSGPSTFANPKSTQNLGLKLLNWTSSGFSYSFNMESLVPSPYNLKTAHKNGG